MLFQYKGSTENQAVSFTQFLMGSVFHGFRVDFQGQVSTPIQ